MISSKHDYMQRQKAVSRRYADIEKSLASKPAERYRWEEELPELVECAKMKAKVLPNYCGQHVCCKGCERNDKPVSL